MDNIRIAVLSAYDKVCAFLDNAAPDGLHYYSDVLHQYLIGSANTFNFEASAKHEDSIHLTVGNKLAFRWRGRDYYFNIMSVVRDEIKVEVEAYSLNFELLNEQLPPYKSEGAKTFEEYLKAFDFEGVLTLKTNEVSDKSISNEWTGSDTMLSRIFSLANVFSAEVEFVPELNDDHSLKKINLNVYRKQSDTDQGIGRSRTDITLRYGVNVAGITKTCEITSIYTAIRPTGRDGLMIYDLDKTELDKDGQVEYQSVRGDGCIRAVQARDRFPSNVLSAGDRYMTVDWSYDTDNPEVLYGQALAQLKKNCVPQVSYDVKGYFDTDIGDVVQIADKEHNPPMYLQARVTEQIRSFTNPAGNQTIFDNFKQLQSQIDPTLLAKMEELIAENKSFTCSIITDNGIVFKNNIGTTVLTASVLDGVRDVTSSLTVKWYKDGTEVASGLSVTVSAVDISGKAVYRFDAKDASGEVKGFYEVTVTNVADGAEGNGIRLMSDYYLAISQQTGVTHDTPGWTTTPQTMTASKKYLWHYTMISYTNGTSKATTPAVIGAFGEDGVDGQPTGVIVSDTEPPNKYTGMLWLHTGSLPGKVTGVTYRWTGSTWATYKFKADNIEADSLAAITANLGTVTAGAINGVSISGVTINGSSFKNTFIADISTHTRLRGTTTVSDGNVRIEYDQESNASGSWVKSGSGSVLLDYGGLTFSDRPNVGPPTNTNIDKTYATLSKYNTKIVTDGNVAVTSTSDNWIKITPVPNYSASNRYLIMANSVDVPLMAHVRSDGWLVGYSPLISSGKRCTVSYMVLQKI